MLRRKASDGGTDLPASVRRAAWMPVSMAHSANRCLIPVASVAKFVSIPALILFHTRGTPRNVVGEHRAAPPRSPWGRQRRSPGCPGRYWRSAR